MVNRDRRLGWEAAGEQTDKTAWNSAPCMCFGGQWNPTLDHVSDRCWDHRNSQETHLMLVCKGLSRPTKPSPLHHDRCLGLRGWDGAPSPCPLQWNVKLGHTSERWSSFNPKSSQLNRQAHLCLGVFVLLCRETSSQAEVALITYRAPAFPLLRPQFQYRLIRKASQPISLNQKLSGYLLSFN